MKYIFTLFLMIFTVSAFAGKPLPADKKATKENSQPLSKPDATATQGNDVWTPG